MPRALLAVVASPCNEIEAHIIAAVLRGEGIPVHVEGLGSAVHDAGLFHQLFPVRVPSPFFKTAMEVLNSVRRTAAARRGTAGEEKPPSVAGIEETLVVMYRHLLFGLLFPPLGLLSGPMACSCSRQALDDYDRLLLDQRDLETKIEAGSRWARSYTAAYYATVIVAISYASGLVK